MTIQFNQRWRGKRDGDVCEMADGAANVLIRRGIASLHKPKRKRAHATHKNS